MNWFLLVSAASIGFVHTLIGPDHYLPFIMMGRAQAWSRTRTLWVTFLCGLGHVLSSVLLGIVGVVFGVALHRLELIESVRGDIAAWALIAFGLIYGAWGLRRALRGRASCHAHVHTHDDGTVHTHGHIHADAAAHNHAHTPRAVMTTWTLFTVFVLGPCEPLIPLLMYPAASESIAGMVAVATVFSLVTIATMMAMVWAISAGVARVPLGAMERFTHAISGAVIAMAGISIQLLGL